MGFCTGRHRSRLPFLGTATGFLEEHTFLNSRMVTQHRGGFVCGKCQLLVELPQGSCVGSANCSWNSPRVRVWEVPAARGTPPRLAVGLSTAVSKLWPRYLDSPSNIPFLPPQNILLLFVSFCSCSFNDLTRSVCPSVHLSVVSGQEFLTKREGKRRTDISGMRREAGGLCSRLSHLWFYSGHHLVGLFLRRMTENAVISVKRRCGWIDQIDIHSGWINQIDIHSGWINQIDIHSEWINHIDTHSGWIDQIDIHSGWINQIDIHSGWMKHIDIPSGWINQIDIHSGWTDQIDIPSGWMNQITVVLLVGTIPSYLYVPFWILPPCFTCWVLFLRNPSCHCEHAGSS